MNKNEVKKLFWNLVKMYVLDEGSIRIYDNHHNVIAEFTEDSEILYILNLFEVLD